MAATTTKSISSSSSLVNGDHCVLNKLLHFVSPVRASEEGVGQKGGGRRALWGSCLMRRILCSQ